MSDDFPDAGKMVTPDLLPCPFCGEAEELTYSCDIISCDSIYGDGEVLCPNCGTLGPSGHGEEEIIAKWNTRAPSIPSASTKG